MAGYIGSKAVNLSTTGADINGNANVDGTLDVTGATTLATADINGGTIDGTVIGGTTPAAGTFTTASTTGLLSSGNHVNLASGFSLLYGDGGERFTGSNTTGTLIAYTANAEAMRIDASGNVLVGMTTANAYALTSGGGMHFNPNADTTIARSGAGAALIVNKTDSDGTAIQFRKGGVTVGSISTQYSGLNIDGAASRSGIYFGTSGLTPRFNGAQADNTIDVGAASQRFDDIYATNGTIQTSDRNEKEAIASLTPTEMLVAARLSTSFKNFKWKDAVAEKGLDAARMHSGIIAQDVQDAFAAEGLDASDYAMFISGTWWEHEGTTYHTLEEAPEGATERTRLGVRYPELLAFVAAYNDQRFLTIETRLTALEATP